MIKVRYECALVERALACEYASELERCVKGLDGLNDIKPLIRDFEDRFAAYIGVKHAVAVNSGSDALKMMLLANGVKKGDEVIVPDLTYQAVPLAVSYCGAKPVPVDARAQDLTMDPVEVERMITRRTKAVVAAHMFGRPCDLDRLVRLCRDRGIVLLEDVCQAESSRWKGRMLGSYGDLGAFSFSYYKPLSSCGGGGGMVVVTDKKYERIRGWMEDWKDDGELLRLGQRFAPLPLMDLVALRVKFAHLKKIIDSRKQVSDFYAGALGSMEGVRIFKDREKAGIVPQNFLVYFSVRDELFAFLSLHGILAQRPYTPLHAMGAYQKSCRRKYPVSEEYFACGLHLPLYSFMGLDKAREVVAVCKAFLGRRSK